ncbi:TrmH family RNA methyltransferase [Bifidobacterium tibiigranuli]|uniref:TrmH family RNA methyltransferase n=1 Tax=Bifidobacterium tibiigranuli TaxID=2172043 RepID=UPI003DA995C9
MQREIDAARHNADAADAADADNTDRDNTDHSNAGYADTGHDDVTAQSREGRVIALDIIPGAVPIESYQFPERCLMLFGAEGPGLSSKALELADDVVYISQFGSVRSINAGAAAAVAMHCWIAQHGRGIQQS